ncbi:recombination directionality factor [Streptacidiphilus anmyonensis]|uniref:recombination directionality factor n=1 Tax=Streptacidiphilus anmyonensis TaxID=405782 RepID=UPI00128B3798|nr:hypothetical protein [Streptacidiphilus anmyonensis]
MPLTRIGVAEVLVEHEDVVGFLMAEESRNGRTVALPAWKMTTGDRAVADGVLRAYGGVRRTRGDGRGYDCMLRCDSIAIRVNPRVDITNHLVLRKGEDLVRVCDGSVLLHLASSSGALCSCPVDAFERRAAARAGTGPKPEVRLTFELAEGPELGRFSLFSSSWELADSLRRVLPGTDTNVDRVELVLDLHRKQFATRSGLDVSIVFPAAASLPSK